MNLSKQKEKELSLQRRLKKFTRIWPVILLTAVIKCREKNYTLSCYHELNYARGSTRNSVSRLKQNWPRVERV